MNSNKTTFASLSLPAALKSSRLSKTNRRKMLLNVVAPEIMMIVDVYLRTELLQN